jgi:hypothetical protein
MRRFLPALILTIIGISLSVLLASREATLVSDHLVGFPDDDKTAHLLRPAVLCALCLIPALAALYYGLAGSLDRYLIRAFMGAFWSLLYSTFFNLVDW